MDVEVLVRCSHNLLTFCSGEMHDAACGRSDREGGDARLAAVWSQAHLLPMREKKIDNLLRWS